MSVPSDEWEKIRKMHVPQDESGKKIRTQRTMKQCGSEDTIPKTGYVEIDLFEEEIT